MVAGALNFVWALGYLVWGAMPLIWAGTMAATAVGQAATGSDPDGPAGAAVIVLGAFAPAIQVVTYTLIALAAPFTLFAGLRLMQLRSRGVVWLGTLVAIGSPLALLLSNGLSLCNISSLGLCLVGFAAGSLGALPVLLYAFIVTIWVGMVMMREEVIVAFEDAAA